MIRYLGKCGWTELTQNYHHVGIASRKVLDGQHDARAKPYPPRNILPVYPLDACMSSCHIQWHDEEKPFRLS